MRIDPAAICVAAIILGLLGSIPARAQGCQPAGSAREATLAGLPAHGDILFDDGSVATIPGLMRADGVAAAASRMQLLSQWREVPIMVRRLPQSDRWGREVAMVSAGERDMAEVLLLTGVALLDPGRAPADCVDIWRAAERRARHERRGAWSADDTPLMPATAPPQGALGRYVLLQGRVTSVGERPRRVYLNFGPPGSGAATVSISTRTWRDLARRGMTAQSLKGRQILVRGIPEQINGRVVMDLAHVAAIEIDS
jgi:Staphylococcal nuclease homologue